MVRKWAIAYEAVTSDNVRLRSKRDGREFSASQVDIISRAKKYVDHEGVKVEIALKMALGQTELVSTALDASVKGTDGLEIFKEFLARNDETNQLLLQEIRGLREDLKQSQVRELSQPSAERNKSEDKPQHGILTRTAMWIESLLRR
jgi:hypothetical protein